MPLPHQIVKQVFLCLASVSTPSTADCNPFTSIQCETCNQHNINFPAVPPAGPPNTSPQTPGTQAPPPTTFTGRPHFVTPPPICRVPEELLDTLSDFSVATPSLPEHWHPSLHNQQTRPDAPASQACFMPPTPEDLLSLTVDPNTACPSPQN